MRVMKIFLQGGGKLNFSFICAWPKSSCEDKNPRIVFFLFVNSWYERYEKVK